MKNSLIAIGYVLLAIIIVASILYLTTLYIYTLMYLAGIIFIAALYGLYANIKIHLDLNDLKNARRDEIMKDFYERNGRK
jgi:hypothetical protein